MPKAQKPVLKLRGNTLDILAHRVCVYVWRRGSRCLYVGISANFMTRYGTSLIGKAEAVLPADTVDIYVPKDWGAAKRLEERLQRKYLPVYSLPATVRNCDPRACLICKIEFTPARWWQKYCPKCSRNGLRREHNQTPVPGMISK